MQNTEVKDYILQSFAKNAGLTAEQLSVNDPTLADLISQSPGMTNSIDLMEVFARTSNSLRKEHGVRVRLPALPLETPISAVLDLFLEEYARQSGQEAVA